jgi:threonine/homoserine/homoserine lactone efflux protein
MVTALEILWKGFALGLLVSVPLGPVGIILINRTIKRGVLSGFFSGLGLGIADAILAIIAGLGFGVIITFINEERFILGIIAGVIIVAAGIKVFLSNPIKDLRHRERSEKSLWRDFYSVFMLAITNPYTI